MISELLGKTIHNIHRSAKDDELLFHCSDGTRYKMYHSQDCCEAVFIEEIVGDLQDLIGSPILRAEENSNSDPIPGATKPYDSFTWTFYRLQTAKGLVVIRWLGQSNGYYSEAVDFVKEEEE